MTQHIPYIDAITKSAQIVIQPQHIPYIDPVTKTVHNINTGVIKTNMTKPYFVGQLIQKTSQKKTKPPRRVLTEPPRGAVSDLQSYACPLHPLKTGLEPIDSSQETPSGPISFFSTKNTLASQKITRPSSFFNEDDPILKRQSKNHHVRILSLMRELERNIQEIQQDGTDSQGNAVFAALVDKIKGVQKYCNEKIAKM